MILSATYEKIDAFAKSSFRLDDSKTKLKLSFSGNGTYLFNSTDGNKSYVLMASLPSDDTKNLSMEKAALKMFFVLKKMRYTDVKVISKRATKVNGYKAYELLGQASNYKNEKEYVFIQLVKRRKVRVQFRGLQNGGDFNQKIFTELINTIRFK